MYTMADYDASVQGKIQPGLARTIQVFSKWPRYQVRRADFFNIANTDLWIQKIDGSRYCLLEKNIPMSWLGEHYIDFVIRLAKSPYVEKIGTFNEIPLVGTPIVPFQCNNVVSPQDLMNAAYAAPPPAITPEPQPNNGGSSGGGGAGWGGTGGTGGGAGWGGTGGTGGGAGWGGTGGTGGGAGPQQPIGFLGSISPTALALIGGGVLLLFFVMRRGESEKHHR